VPFRSLLGHRRVVSLLARAVARNRLPPSLLLAGPAGVGKRRLALALAETLNCLQPAPAGELERDACGECAACRRIARGIHPDVIVVEPGETGSIKIEEIREVVARAAYRPFEGRRRAVVIDQADALTAEAQSALLKTLEEPPAASVFVLVSSIPDALLPTILSRCPRLRLGSLSAAEVAEVLRRDHGYSEDEAHAAAADADGSVGRALAAESADLAGAREAARRLLEQTARVSDPSRRIELARALSAGGKGTTPASERDQMGAALRALASLLRDVGLLATDGDPAALANSDLAPQLQALARSYDRDRSLRAYQTVDQALAALGRNANPKIVADWLVMNL
jgi:DNA polymerase-3 subunit delta'